MSSGVRSTAQKKDEKGRVRHGGEWLAIWSDPNSTKNAAELREDAAANRAILQRQAALAASVRSISKCAAVQVRFGEAAHNGMVSLPALDPDASDHQAVRGNADAQASVLRFHDAAVHADHRPKQRISAKLFDVIEKARCHGLGVARFGGVEANLIAFQVSDLQQLDLLNAHLASLIPLPEALRMVLRDVFAGRETASIQTAGFRNWDRWLRDRYAHHLQMMSDSLADQSAFALAGKAFLHDLLAELPNGGEIDRRLTPTAQDAMQSGNDDILKETDDPQSSDLKEPGELDFAEEMRDAQVVSLPEKMDLAPYAVFTSRHDRVVQATELSDRATLHAFRKQLDEKQAEYRRDIARLSLRLQRTLMARQTRRWDFDQDEGLIDASRLDRVIVKPGFSSCYKKEMTSPFLDTIVTLLIDNSGSMRGKPIETACIVADVLTAALERCAITTEVLGFTTQNWKGGQSAKDWVAAGKPENPGRLNDVLHLIYKNAQTPLRRARDALCAMMSPGLLKENIDGEALSWAAGRLLSRPEQRRVLIVISDGAPMDQATFDANSDKRLLDRHLRQTIRWIESETNIELCAIGIKHELHDLYSQSTTIENVTDLGAVLMDALDELLKN